MGTLKVKDQTTGLWVYAGTPGPAGPTGPTGPMGVSTIIVGNFGAITTPADLPPDGVIPVDWDGPGKPATSFTVTGGESLYYEKPGDPLDGHLFQYVTTAYDPTGWIDVGLIQGPIGVTGPTGPSGDPGMGLDEMTVGPDEPIEPQVEFWYDTDEPDPPPAGLIQPRIAFKTMLASAVVSPVNVMTAIITGTVKINPDYWYHIFAGVRCVSDPAAWCMAQFQVFCGVGLQGYDVVNSGADPNGLFGAWSQNWLEQGVSLNNTGSPDTVLELRAQANVAGRTFYSPRLYVIEYPVIP